MEGILTSEGKPFELNNVNPLIGYQAEHRITGRLLPLCNRFEVYDLFSLLDKMGTVAEFMDERKIAFNIFEYEAVPIYEAEIDGNFVFIKNNFDIS